MICKLQNPNRKKTDRAGDTAHKYPIIMDFSSGGTYNIHSEMDKMAAQLTDAWMPSICKKQLMK